MSSQLNRIAEGEDRGWLRRFLSVARYLNRTDDGDPAIGGIDFESVDSLWQALARSSVGIFTEVRLNDVAICEWVPVSPGASTLGRSINHENLTPQSLEETVDGWRRVYYPQDKNRFLDAGYGCVRFGPHELGAQKSELMLLGATSSKNAHDGFPVAVSAEIYADLIEDIRRYGSAQRSILGRLEWLPERFVGKGDVRRSHNPFLRYDSIPRVFLRASSIKKAKRRPGHRLAVTVATSFIGKVEGELGFYGAFGTFDPSRIDSFVETRDWLYNSYIRDRYKGTVVTDFDEHFPVAEAGASLDRVMSGQIDLATLKSAFVATLKADGYTSGAWRNQAIRRFMIEVSGLAGYSVSFVQGDLVIGDQYNVKQAAAVGPNATATGNQLNQHNTHAGIDLDVLAEELEVLRKASSSKVSTVEDAIAYSGISEAQRAANSGDPRATESGLLRAGDWALAVAKELGLSLAVEALTRAIELNRTYRY